MPPAPSISPLPSSMSLPSSRTTSGLGAGLGAVLGSSSSSSSSSFSSLSSLAGLSSLPTFSSSSSSPPLLHLPEKTRALQQVLEHIDKEFGECNERIKENIRQITILYTPSNQKILSTFFTPKERDSIYTIIRPNHMEMYQQLYKLFLELHQQRNTLTNAIYQNNPSLKALHEYMEIGNRCLQTC